MSGWENYIAALCGTGKIASAAIHGINGVRYAGSDDLQVTSDQALTLVEAIEHEPMAALLPLKGIHLGDTKYTYLRHDPGRNIYGRTKESTGCCITKTTTLIIIATHPASVSTANCVTEVEKMADYLISMQM